MYMKVWVGVLSAGLLQVCSVAMWQKVIMNLRLEWPQNEATVVIRLLVYVHASSIYLAIY